MKTALYDRHAALGGRMVDFFGWELPVQYGGILEEHRAVRENAGLFDVSHMGELFVTGGGALCFLQTLTTNDLSRLSEGRAVYSPVCYQGGGTVDDVIIYPRPGGYMICCNASNADKDFAWFSSQAGADVKVENVSVHYAQLALQGPLAGEILQSAGGGEIAALRPYTCGDYEIGGRPVFAAATGYTGERGAELYISPEHAPEIWDRLIEAGAKPCGLGARDSLRLEAGLPLYGHELSETISPVMAGLSRFIKPDKGDFIGREALVRQLNDPGTPKIAGLTLNGRAIPRAGYEVKADGRPCGAVTSGGVAPTLGGSVALALINGTGGAYTVTIRGKDEPASFTEPPFYRRKK